MRFAVLLGIGKAREPKDFCLIDIKEATAAAAPRAPGANMPRDNAERVVDRCAAPRAVSRRADDGITILE